MCGGKDHAWQAQSIVPDETPRASGSAPTAGPSGSSDNAIQTVASGESNTQSTHADDESRSVTGTTY